MIVLSEAKSNSNEPVKLIRGYVVSVINHGMCMGFILYINAHIKCDVYTLSIHVFVIMNLCIASVYYKTTGNITIYVM
jgi:hypothetical protein